MNTLSRKSLIGTFALLASLSAPLVFAQSATTAVSAATPQATAAVQSTTQADPQATAQTAASVQAATPATSVQANTATASPVKKSWSDVDGDKDGKLSKAEASAVPALGELFDKADGNADGALTTDEYKTYIAKAKSTGNGGGKGGASK